MIYKKALFYLCTFNDKLRMQYNDKSTQNVLYNINRKIALFSEKYIDFC